MNKVKLKEILLIHNRSLNGGGGGIVLSFCTLHRPIETGKILISLIIKKMSLVISQSVNK